MTEALAVETHALTKRFGDFIAVDAVDLGIREGELFGLLGPNGAGKTTLVRMLTGLITISAGEARVAGVDVRHAPTALRRAIGVVPQALTSDLELTGWENLDIFGKFYDIARGPRHARIEELLRTVALWDRRDDLVKQYSGGMRRRLEIARGLVHRPHVLFLDEPTMGLDPQSRLVIWDLLRALRQGGGLTISLTTHYLDEADALCDRVAIVDHGKIAALGTPDALKAALPGSDTLDLGLASPVPAGVVAELKRIPEVRALEVNGALKIRADRGAELLPRVLLELDKHGVRVTSANLSRITLEDVFIHFTGRSLREDSGGPAGGPVAGPARRFT